MIPRDRGGEPATVVGVATGRPDGGVAIVRVSGPAAFEIGTALAGALPTGRRAGLRRLRLRTGTEDALVVCMERPNSFTGEDVVEFQVHGGRLNVGQVVEAVIGRGARPAGAGEFTRRAFDHGRLGLEQAEGIAALIGAQTEGALLQARRLVAGELGREVDELRAQIGALRVEVEANLDFPEEVEPRDIARWNAEAAQRRRTLRAWLRGFEAARRGRERARIVLAGPPNAGKSSLFNALLGHRRALVSPRPGTTRDYVEAELGVAGYCGVLVDTAGLHAGADPVELAGVALARDQVSGADVVLWVEGADGEPRAPEQAMPVADGVAVFRVETKRDLGCRRADWIGASSESEPGVRDVLEALEGWFRDGADEAWIGLARHRERVEDAETAVGEAIDLMAVGGARLELVAFDLAVAERRLGEITGRHDLGPVGLDVLHAIFSRFCIGK